MPGRQLSPVKRDFPETLYSPSILGAGFPTVESFSGVNLSPCTGFINPLQFARLRSTTGKIHRHAENTFASSVHLFCYGSLFPIKFFHQPAFGNSFPRSRINKIFGQNFSGTLFRKRLQDTFDGNKLRVGPRSIRIGNLLINLLRCPWINPSTLQRLYSDRRVSFVIMYPLHETRNYLLCRFGIRFYIASEAGYAKSCVGNI